MKTILYALILAALLTGLFYSPTSAAACGATYTVQKGDYLTKIAQTCGVTYDSLIKANPEIKNPNIIYVGQVIRIQSGASLPNVTATPSTSTVAGFDYTVVKGDTLSKIAVRYGVTLNDLLKANPKITNASLLYVGQKIRVPYGSSSGMVTLSATSAKVGTEVEVKVKGFPANMDIDFRLGKEGQAYSVVADGKTNASGEASVKMTIPSAAKSGEKWVVRVLTTGMVSGREATSSLITITQ